MVDILGTLPFYKIDIIIQNKYDRLFLLRSKTEDELQC